MSDMSTGLEKTTVYLDSQTRRGLKALSRSTGRPQAELIREALDAYLERAPRYALPGWVGIWKHGPETDASEIKHVARERWANELEREDP
jgi:predicted DNA-binding protein